MKIDLWYTQRNEREDNATFATAKRWRRCPYDPCESTGTVLVHPGTRIDPPEYDDCPICQGTGRVDQEDWEEAVAMNRAHDEYERQMAEDLDAT